MIAITRDLARQLRAILRKAGTGPNQHPLIEMTTGRGELHICAQLPDIVVAYKQPGPDHHETLPVPFEALADCEGNSKSSVTFARIADGIELSWEDHGIPQRQSYRVAEAATRPTIPDIDWSTKALVPGFLQALEQASQCVAGNDSRFATDKIQLRGERGEIIATDSRQALIQGGFTFSWKDDLLIPGLSLYGCRSLPLDQPVSVCKGDTHLAIQVGNWSLFLVMDKQGIFPDIARVIPNIPSSATTLRLSPEDAAFLAKSLGKLPGNRTSFSPVTIDLSGQIVLRVKKEDQDQATELLLAGSVMVGPPVRLHADRRFLARAVFLGCTEITIVRADKPVVCKANNRTYVWVPLEMAAAIAPSDNAIRISTQQQATIRKPIKERTNASMRGSNSSGYDCASGASQCSASPTGNGQISPVVEGGDRPTAPASTSLGALIVEAQNLRDYLREGYVRANRLVSFLKNHRKQSRLVASTLATLKQLQQIEA